MTINLQYVSTIVYNTTTGQANYSYPYQFLKKEDLFVTKIDNLGVETLLTLNSDYTIEDKSDYRTGATVTLLVPIATGNKLAIGLDIEIEQTNQYPSYQAFPSKVTETAFDKISLLLLQFKNTLDRTVKVALDSVGVNISFPTPVVDRFLVWENTGGKLKNSTYSADTFLTNAQNSATAAANSASAAAISATNADTSEANAATSESNADISEANAAASATLAGQYANRATDSAIPGFPTEYSSRHYRDKTIEALSVLNGLTSGVYLAWQSRTTNFTVAPGGRYLLDVASLTANTTLTITPPSSPDILTEYEIFCPNCTDVRSVTFSNTPNTIEGYESEQLKMAEPFFVKMKWNTVTSKWYPILRKLARLLPRVVSSNITYNGGNPVKPGDVLNVDTSLGQVTIDLPFGNVLPTIGDEVTIIDAFKTFDVNKCVLRANGKNFNFLNINLDILDKGFRATFVYMGSPQGWIIK